MTSGPTVSHAICFVSAEAVLTTACAGRRVHYGSGTPPAPLCAERTPRGTALVNGGARAPGDSASAEQCLSQKCVCNLERWLDEERVVKCQPQAAVTLMPAHRGRHPHVLFPVEVRRAAAETQQLPSKTLTE